MAVQLPTGLPYGERKKLADAQPPPSGRRLPAPSTPVPAPAGLPGSPPGETAGDPSTIEAASRWVPNIRPLGGPSSRPNESGLTGLADAPLVDDGSDIVAFLGELYRRFPYPEIAAFLGEVTGRRR